MLVTCLFFFPAVLKRDFPCPLSTMVPSQKSQANSRAHLGISFSDWKEPRFLPHQRALQYQETWWKRKFPLSSPYCFVSFISTFPSVSHPQLQVRFGKHLNNPAIYLGVIKISNLVKNDFTFILKIPITLIWLCILSIPRVCVINVLFCFFKQTFVREQYYENLVFDLAKIGWGCLVGLSKENFYCSTKCLWLCAIKKCGKYFWLLTI